MKETLEESILNLEYLKNILGKKTKWLDKGRLVRVFQKKKIFSFPILATFIVKIMGKYSHTQKISSKS